jgi:hypothetical protein
VDAYQLALQVSHQEQWVCVVRQGEKIAKRVRAIRKTIRDQRVRKYTAVSYRVAESVSTSPSIETILWPLSPTYTRRVHLADE